jgi:hypothetical protein
MKSLIICAVGLDLALGQAGRKFDSEWPKRSRTDYASIPKTSDDKFWMDGYYSTLVNQVGDLKFEMG